MQEAPFPKVTFYKRIVNLRGVNIQVFEAVLKDMILNKFCSKSLLCLQIIVLEYEIVINFLLFEALLILQVWFKVVICILLLRILFLR